MWVIRINNSIRKLDPSIMLTEFHEKMKTKILGEKVCKIFFLLKAGSYVMHHGQK